MRARIVTLFALVTCCACGPLPSLGLRRSRRPSERRETETEEDADLEDRIIQTRGSGLIEVAENATHPLLQRTLLRSAAWLRRHNPGLWLVVVAMAATHDLQRTKRAKKGELADIRLQVELGEDYHIAIVTTAALPWMTGTAVNPLLRAAHLAQAGKRVTLMVPWLHPLEQDLIFPGGLRFDSPEAQAAHIHQWLRERAGMKARFRLKFYPGRYDTERGSILPLGDITRFFEAEESDICVLEEPEHLTWYHKGPNWRHRFKLVVGVVHTNYIFYAHTWEKGGALLAATLRQINGFMCQAYCDKVIKLSDTLQPLPRAVTCNVHGVRADFLEIGKRAGSGGHRFSKGAYFLGKALWAKGHRLLLEYLQLQRERGEPLTHVDLYGKGKGEELEEIRSAFSGLDADFHGPTDHAGREIWPYRVFVNPSQSEVLSTTTAEALAMGKFVVIQRHPSNEFFMGFANTLAYDTPDEFLQQLDRALTTLPQPLSADERRRLSWEGATERFLGALTDATLGSTLPSLSDHTASALHHAVLKGGKVSDVLRKASGAGPVSLQSWLPKYRDADVVELVNESIERQPPASTGGG